MKCVIYTKNDINIPVSKQFQECARYAMRNGLYISYHITGLKEDDISEAIDKVLFNENISTLIIFDRQLVLKSYDDYLFLRIYLEKFGKELKCSQ